MICPVCKYPDAKEVELLSSTAIDCPVCDGGHTPSKADVKVRVKLLGGIESVPIVINVPDDVTISIPYPKDPCNKMTIMRGKYKETYTRNAQGGWDSLREWYET